ncbi:MAG: hypothetical protein J7L82_02475 [Staphylothermus sp.]|nr:hypothetical protein [Staphylothermus sp.]
MTNKVESGIERIVLPQEVTELHLPQVVVIQLTTPFEDIDSNHSSSNGWSINHDSFPVEEDVYTKDISIEHYDRTFYNIAIQGNEENIFETRELSILTETLMGKPKAKRLLRYKLDLNTKEITILSLDQTPNEELP